MGIYLHKRVVEAGQQLQAIYGDEAKLTCRGYKRIYKGEHQGRTYSRRANQSARILATTPKGKQRKENV